MPFKNQNQTQCLEMKAQCVLNDISNQQDRKTRFNWVSKSNSDKKSSIKFPSIANYKHLNKKQFKYTPWLIRKKGNLYRQKTNKLINDVQKDANFSQNYASINLSESCGKENYDNSSALSKKRKNIKFKTENSQQGDENSSIYHTSFLLKNKGFDNESKMKRNWSVHIRKALATLNRQKDTMNKQIQSIKSLIQDKRTKCRMLSKQGCLIVKQQIVDNENRHFNSSFQILGQKNKSVQRIKMRQKSGLKSTLSIRPVDDTFQSVIKCKSFLTNAYQILSIRSSVNQF